MLGEQRLDLRETDRHPILQPAFGEIVADAVQPALAHSRMIGVRLGGYMGRTAYFPGPLGLT